MSSRASGSKRRNTGESSSQPPLDPTRLWDEDVQERAEIFEHKPIVVERSIHCEDLHAVGLRALLYSRGWETPMRTMGGNAHRAITREFYCNARLPRDGRRYIKVWVRSRTFICDENLIATVLGVRREQNPIYPLANAEDLTLCCRELTGDPHFVWMPHQKHIPQGILTDKYKLLNLLAVANITPQCRHNQVFEKRIRLIHAIGTGVPMDLCSIILGEMMTAVEDVTLRGALPFGKMVTEMCQMHEVDFDPRDDIVRGMAPIDGGTLKRSRSARAAQREGGQGQEEEDEEEREEFMALDGGGGGSHTQGSGSSQGENPSLKAMMEQLQINHQLVMHRLDQQDERMKEWMRRYPPPPPPQE